METGDTRDREEALLHIQDFLDRIYNCERLYSIPNYLSAATYEAKAGKPESEPVESSEWVLSGLS